MSHLIKPLARIALRGDFPRELIRLLSSLRLDPFGAGGLDAEIVVAFTGQKDGGWMLHLRQTPGVAGKEGGIFCDNAYVAASILLSRVLGLNEPFIVASEPSYAVLRDAIQLAAGPANILIEGETGTGKRTLAELISRTSRNPGGAIHVDCAVAADVGRIVATTRAPRDIGQTGIVLLDHLAELPREAHQALAEVMRHRKERFVATSRLSLRRMVEKGAFAQLLLRGFDATLQMPLLSRRRTDLEVLARHFLRNANPLLQLDSTALATLRYYRFAGNVRELRNMMIRVAICESDDNARTIDRVRIEGHCGNSSGLGGSRLITASSPISNNGSQLRLISSTDGAGNRRRCPTKPFEPANLRLAESRS